MKQEVNFAKFPFKTSSFLSFARSNIFPVCLSACTKVYVRTQDRVLSCTRSEPRLTYACLLMCKHPGTSVAACVLCAVCALTQLCGGSGWGPWQLSGRQRPQRVLPSRLQYSSPDRPSCDLFFGISCIRTIPDWILTVGPYSNVTRGMEAVVFSLDG